MILVLDGNPFENLANAIILQAVVDYRHAVRRIKRDPENYLAKDRIRDVEKFFRSWWFAQLTNLDGELLLERLRKESENDKRRS